MNLSVKLQIAFEPGRLELLSGLHKVLAPVLDEACHLIQVVKRLELPGSAFLQHNFDLQIEGVRADVFRNTI